ncbi:hypothetical protein CEXT_296151 [Caerostris extrusa]|uniref:Ycf15 n=1 Tax=Caerostris extrusa TaxID=172846 RepID=A0AAV4X3I7_CAEEX|nr:hypothetical protein CEXT_296151 [Caerostris extrusa]
MTNIKDAWRISVIWGRALIYYSTLNPPRNKQKEIRTIRKFRRFSTRRETPHNILGPEDEERTFPLAEKEFEIGTKSSPPISLRWAGGGGIKILLENF